MARVAAPPSLSPTSDSELEIFIPGPPDDYDLDYDLDARPKDAGPKDVRPKDVRPKDVRRKDAHRKDARRKDARRKDDIRMSGCSVRVSAPSSRVVSASDTASTASLSRPGKSVSFSTGSPSSVLYDSAAPPMTPWLRTPADEKLYIPLDNDFCEGWEWRDEAPAGEVPMDCARPIIDTPAKEARCPGDFRVTASQSRGVAYFGSDVKLHIPLDNHFRDTYPPTPERRDVAPDGEVPMDCARPIIDTPAKEARCPGDFRVTAPQSRGVSASDTPTTDALPKDARPKDATTSDAAQTSHRASAAAAVYMPQCGEVAERPSGDVVVNLAGENGGDSCEPPVSLPSNMIAAGSGFVCNAPLCQETRENGFANKTAISINGKL